MLISYVKGTNTDINNFLFGSLLAVGKSDCILSVVLSLIVIVSYILLYPRLYAVTFDPVFARSAGVKADRYTTLLAVLAALTITLGMRMLGSLLISALIIFPCLSAMRVMAVVCFILGFSASYAFGTPAGASIVIMHLIAFLLALAAGYLKERGIIRH